MGAKLGLSQKKKRTQAEVIQEQDAEEDIWPKRERVTGDWRRLHNEELCDTYFTQNITWVIKLRIMSWVGHNSTYCGKEMYIQGFDGET